MAGTMAFSKWPILYRIVAIPRVIATLLDEAMSKANRARGILAMTRQMEVEYLRPVPLQTPLILTAQHTGNVGRKNHCEAQIADASGIVLAKGKALFITVDPKYLNLSSNQKKGSPS